MNMSGRQKLLKKKNQMREGEKLSTILKMNSNKALTEKSSTEL